MRQVARRRFSQFGSDGSRGFGSSQCRGARPLEGFEKVRGGKLDAAIDEVLRQKRLESNEGSNDAVIRCGSGSDLPPDGRNVQVQDVNFAW